MAIPDRLNNYKFYRDFVLSSQERELYDAFLVSFQRDYNRLPYTRNDLTDNQWQKVMHSIVFDNPEIISHCLYKSSDNGEPVDMTNIRFFKLEKRTSEELKIIDQIVDEIKEKTRDLPEIDKAFYIFEYLSRNVEYDSKALDMVKRNSPEINNCLRVFDMTGALIDKKAVCQGISLAYLYLLHAVNIRSYIQACTSKGVGHCYNVLMIDVNGETKYINVDLTLTMKREDSFYFYQGSKKKYSFNKWGFGVSSQLLSTLGYELMYNESYNHVDDGENSYFAKNNLVFNQFPKIRRYIRSLANRHECISFIYTGSINESQMRNNLLQLSIQHNFKDEAMVYTSAPFYMICGGDLYE